MSQFLCSVTEKGINDDAARNSVHIVLGSQWKIFQEKGQDPAIKATAMKPPGVSVSQLKITLK